MPKSQPKSSTTRRKQLTDFVDSSGDIMVKACSTCVKHGRVYKVHVRSGKCSEDNTAICKLLIRNGRGYEQRRSGFDQLYEK